MRLALYQPDIPQNLGAAIRLSACLGVGLDVIEPCGFPLTDRSLKRAALDYGARADVTHHPSLAAFTAARREFFACHIVQWIESCTRSDPCGSASVVPMCAEAMGRLLLYRCRGRLCLIDVAAA